MARATPDRVARAIAILKGTKKPIVLPKESRGEDACEEDLAARDAEYAGVLDDEDADEVTAEVEEMRDHLRGDHRRWPGKGSHE